MKISVVGGYGVGLTMRVDRAPSAGETVTGGILAAGPGGKGSNQAIACARLGAEVSLFTAVGRDAAADEARRLWSEERVDARHILTSERSTMTGFILVEPSGENRIAIAPGALDAITSDDVEVFREAIRAADILIVSLEVPVEAAAAALRIAREVGTRTLLNPAPASSLPQSMLDDADVITPNLGEARRLLGREGLDDEPAHLARLLRERTAATIVLTLGDSGACLLEGDELSLIGAPAAGRIVDTTGAGDAFTAALGVAIAEGSTMTDAVAFANAAGCHAVQVEGVVPSLPTRQELDARMTRIAEKVGLS